MGKKKEKAKMQLEHKILMNHKKYDAVSQNEHYSVQRLDIIIIALATGGITVVLAILQKLQPKGINWFDKTFLIVALVLFVLSIAGNIIAQHASIRTSRVDKKHYLHRLRALHDMPHDNIPEAKCWEKTRVVFEFISYISIILAAVTLTIYFANY